MLQQYYFLIVIVVFIAIFYFMAIRPQSKQRKAHQEMMSTLKKGDQVMTASGIYGVVKRVDDQVVVIEIAKGITMKVVRRAIADIIRDPERAKALAPEAASGGSRKTRKPKAESANEDELVDIDEAEDEE